MAIKTVTNQNTAVASTSKEGGKSARKLKNAATAFLRHAHRSDLKQPNIHNLACNLPEVIICKVLLECAQLDVEGWSWIMLTHVCHIWRKVALSYQELWGFIDFSHPKWTAITMQRAKLVPLRIRAIVDADNIKYLRRTMQLAHRVDEIRLKSSVQHIHPLLESLVHPNPAIQSLSVEVCVPKDVAQGAVYPPPSFPTDGPRLATLKYLELKGCPFYLLSSRCTALTELHLHDIPTSERPRRRHLAAVLERLSNLQHLTLDRAFPIIEDNFCDTARRVILPRVKAVNLRGSVGEIADALDNLILPSSACLAIGVHSWAAAEVLPLETLVITGKESNRYIGEQEINPDFRQSIHSTHCTDEIMIITLGAIWRALALAHVHTIALQNLDVVTQKSWSQLLRTLPSLRVLDITGHAPSGVIWALLLDALAHTQVMQMVNDFWFQD
ncbi:hypothetical protein BDQ17DRAFT_1420269 [Cyathus striatus]|nr:hypothetical protein BDQ17DRAFT_1420269 [Cyathus striatus]